MSQLDQAKKEAKRLFNLAKVNQKNSKESSITLPNLSSAKEIVAIINGYKDWHEYEENLKRKDFIFDKVDKSTQFKEDKKIKGNESYYLQDIKFNTFINSRNYQNIPIVVEKEHTPIILGDYKINGLFEKNKKSWLLNQYPVLLTGSTGAGKTETLLSLTSQYIQNKEGAIYIDGKGDNSLYVKMFSYAQEYNRLNDLYCINFMRANAEVVEQKRESHSHSIDPINPMVGNDDYFNFFFGEKMGGIIHAILKKTHAKNQLMDIQSLESTLMLNNLLQWRKGEAFGEVLEINEYLDSLGISEDKTILEEDMKEVLEKHAFNANKAYEIIKLIKNYKNVFKLNASIDMERIFLQRKILLVLLPALEKSISELELLGELIVQQITYVDKKLSSYNIHFQNIVFDEFTYYVKNIKKFNFAQTKNNYLFGAYGFEYNNQESFDTIMLNARTYIVMKLEEIDLPNKLKLDMINNMEEPSPIVYAHKYRKTIKGYSSLNQQLPGQAVVFCKNETTSDKTPLILNNEYKYYVQPLQCIYISTSYRKQTWLVDH